MASAMFTFDRTPVERPRSSAYSRIVLRGVPSFSLRRVSGPWLMTPFHVFLPVTMAVMPAAESVTQAPSGDVSESASEGQL